MDFDKLADTAQNAVILLTNLSDNDDNDRLTVSLSLLGKKIRSKLEYFINSSKVLFIIDGVMNAATIRFFDEYKVAF